MGSIAQLVKNLPVMQETQVQSLSQEDPLEKEMATHSSILAWKILWAEEPSGLLSMGSQESESAPRQNILHIMPLSVFHLCFTCYALNYKHKVTYQR